MNGNCAACADPGATPTIGDVVCVCNAGTGTSGGDYHEVCAPCDGTCANCWKAGDANFCETCSGVLTFTPVSRGFGSCTLVCANGCAFCFGTAADECLTQEQSEFIDKIAALTSDALPLTTETNGLMCYRQSRPTTSCTPDPLETVVGSITDYTPTGSAKPTLKQCKKLLVAYWPFLMRWFTEFFGTFVGPSGATADELLTIKSTLYLWILQFGPAEMSATEWDTLKTDLKSAGNLWSSFLGWTGSPPQYSTEGANAAGKNFPTVLSNWITTTCGNSMAGCLDLQVFNLKSTVCNITPCSIQSHCSIAFPGSNCAFYS